MPFRVNVVYTCGKSCVVQVFDYFPLPSNLWHMSPVGPIEPAMLLLLLVIVTALVVYKVLHS